MKRRFILPSCVLLLAMAAGHELRAQSNEGITPTDIKTPNAPAFTIVDVEPTSIQRPTTPRAFALSLVSAASGNSLIPENYAVELAPYWLKPRPQLQFKDYYRPSGWQAVRQTFSLSMAVSNVFRDTDSAATHAGFGFRVMPAVGRPPKSLEKLVNDIDALQNRRLDFRLELRELQRTITATQEELETARKERENFFRVRKEKLAAGTGSYTDAEMKELDDQVRRWDEAVRILGDRLASLQKKVADINKEMEDDRIKLNKLSTEVQKAENAGFKFQLAGAFGAKYPQKNYEARNVFRYGIWSTFGYRMEKPSLDFLLLTRLIVNSGAAERNFFDMGARVAWDYKKISFSGEWVNRTLFDYSKERTGPGTSTGALNYDNSQRLIGNIEYQVSQDIHITTTFGRNYAINQQVRKTLVAMLGIMVQLGKLPSVSKQ